MCSMTKIESNYSQQQKNKNLSYSGKLAAWGWGGWGRGWGHITKPFISKTKSHKGD